MARLSHSAVNRYTGCPKSFYFHYVKNYRSILQSSPLIFGNVLDKAVEVYLLTKDVAKAEETLASAWTTQDVNGTTTELYGCPYVVYSNGDYDSDLLLPSDLSKLEEEYGNDVLSQVADIFKQKKTIGFQYLKREKKVLLNKANWLCMLRKGEYMLKEAIRVIDSTVVECLGTQVEIDLDNGEGDSIKGYCDFVARIVGHEEPVIIDLKTSSRFYEHDSVRNSQQLSLYLHSLEDRFKTRKCAFFVVLKVLSKDKVKICKLCGHDGSERTHRTCPEIIDGKRCGGEWDEKSSFRAKSQFIVDEIPQQFEKIIIENFDMVNKAVKAEIFPRNLGNCDAFGGCVFTKFCLQNCSLKESGLIVKEA